MNKVTYFYINGCPYCVNADRAREELIAENAAYADVVFDKYEEYERKDMSDQYDYQATPAMFIDDELIYQAYLFEPYEECKAHVKDGTDKALAG